MKNVNRGISGVIPKIEERVEILISTLKEIKKENARLNRENNSLKKKVMTLEKEETIQKEATEEYQSLVTLCKKYVSKDINEKEKDKKTY